jgi:hypothetical protein
MAVVVNASFWLMQYAPGSGKSKWTEGGIGLNQAFWLGFNVNELFLLAALPPNNSILGRK